MAGFTYEELEKVSLAYDEHRYWHVTLPRIQEAISNVDDDGLRKLLADKGTGRTLRQQVVEKLALEAAPWHLRPDEAPVKRERALPLEGISASAARGIVQAVREGLVPHVLWLQVQPVYQRIKAAAQAP